MHGKELAFIREKYVKIASFIHNNNVVLYIFQQFHIKIYIYFSTQNIQVFPQEFPAFSFLIRSIIRKAHSLSLFISHESLYNII